MSEKSNDGLITVTASAEINNTDFFGVIELFCSSYNDISEGNASAEITIQGIMMLILLPIMMIFFYSFSLIQ